MKGLETFPEAISLFTLSTHFFTCYLSPVPTSRLLDCLAGEHFARSNGPNQSHLTKLAFTNDLTKQEVLVDGPLPCFHFLVNGSRSEEFT